jgi:hypothetical protein
MLVVGTLPWWGGYLKDLIAAREIATIKARGRSLLGTAQGAPSEKAVNAKKQAVYASGKYDEPGFTRMPPAQPGDWLWVVPEPGQTFEEYQRQVRNRRTAERRVIYL